MQNVSFVFSGSGGQGVITAAILLAEAAVIYEGLNAVQSQAYGAEARGGASRSDVIISRDAIYFPEVHVPNYLITLTQQSYDKFYPLIKTSGTIIADNWYVKDYMQTYGHIIKLPLYARVMEEIGKPIVLNICMLGAVVEITKIVKPESIMKVLEQRINPDFLDINRKALELGVRIAKECVNA